jgi:hypothetical protein
MKFIVFEFELNILPTPDSNPGYATKSEITLSDWSLLSPVASILLGAELSCSRRKDFQRYHSTQVGALHGDEHGHSLATGEALD